MAFGNFDCGGLWTSSLCFEIPSRSSLTHHKTQHCNRRGIGKLKSRRTSLGMSLQAWKCVRGESRMWMIAHDVERIVMGRLSSLSLSGNFHISMDNFGLRIGSRCVSLYFGPCGWWRSSFQAPRLELKCKSYKRAKIRLRFFPLY